MKWNNIKNKTIKEILNEIAQEDGAETENYVLKPDSKMALIMMAAYDLGCGNYQNKFNYLEKIYQLCFKNSKNSKQLLQEIFVIMQECQNQNNYQRYRIRRQNWQ
jgi:hypothetical protein